MTLEKGFIFDVFNLLVAGLGLFGGIPVIMDWFTKPKIVISDVTCRRRRYFDLVPTYNEYGEIDGAEEQPALTIISWRVKNEKKLLSSNRGILDLKTKYHFSRIDPDATRDYQWSGETSTWPLLGVDEDISQETRFEKRFISNGKYSLNLNVLSGTKVVYSYREEITVETRTRRLRKKKST